MEQLRKSFMHTLRCGKNSCPRLLLLFRHAGRLACARFYIAASLSAQTAHSRHTLFS